MFCFVVDSLSQGTIDQLVLTDFVGDSFSAGDVLLEIETDKAQIDVEAQDDGILAKIYAQNGEKNVAVGHGIAAIAEPNDDISSIELPAPSSEASAKPEQKSEPAQQQQETQKPAVEEKKQQEKSASVGDSASANPDQTLLPSVLNLLHQNHVSEEDAIGKIPATGPNGRLLKGDVLAYLGVISKDSLNAVNSNIKSTQHLDLSNIKAKAPQHPSAAKEPEAAKEVAKEKPSKPEPIVLRNTFSLSDISLLRTTVDATLSTNLSINTLVEKASKLAHRDVGVLSKPKKSALNDPLFDALVAPPKTTKKPFEEKFTFKSGGPLTKTATADVLDILASPRKPVSSPATKATAAPQQLDVAVKVNTADGEKKGQLYLDRLQYYLTNGKGDLLL